MAWRAVVGFEGVCEVSEAGNIRSIDRAVVTARGIRKYRGKVFSPQILQNGYQVVSLSRAGAKPIKAYVHRVVAEAFLGPAPFPRADVNHIDGCKTNNNLSNLEWVTRQENVDHAKSLGLVPKRRYGSESPAAKLTEFDVHSIRCLLANGCSQREIAKLYNVSRGPIDQIARGLTWRHVK